MFVAPTRKSFNSCQLFCISIMEYTVGSLLCFSLCQCSLPFACLDFTICWQYFENFSSKTQYGQDLSSQVQQRDLFHQNLTASLSKEKIMDMVIITIFLLIINNFISQKKYLQHQLKKTKEQQKQLPRGVPRKRCLENMQQIYRRTPMPKYDYSKVALQLY